MPKDDDQTIMSPSEMKPLLMLSKREPVNCAIGLSKDKDGLVLLNKKAKPRKMAAMLKKAAAEKSINLDMSTVRFGTASVDTEIDSALVQFKVNKEAPGAMRPKLLALLKKAGFGKCEIFVDGALENEPEDDSEEPAEADAAAPAASSGAPADPAASAAPPPPPPEAEAKAAPADGSQPDAAPAGGNQPDAAALTQRLTGLVKRMMALLSSNPAGADAMKTAAVAAQTALKSGDLQTAGASADTLERMLDAAPPAAPAGGPAMGSPVFAKAQATWVATRKKVESELEKLHDEMQAVYKGHGVVADLEKAFRSKIEPMMAAFDHSLSDKLDEVNKNADPAAHAKLVSEAKAIIAKYEDFLGSDPLIAKLDDNPFVPLALEKTLTASLAALSKVVA